MAGQNSIGRSATFPHKAKVNILASVYTEILRWDTRRVEDDKEAAPVENLGNMASPTEEPTDRKEAA